MIFVVVIYMCGFGFIIVFFIFILLYYINVLFIVVLLFLYNLLELSNFILYVF